MAPEHRPPGFDLAAALASPAFTPRAQDLPALVGLLEAEDTVAAAERGLVRLGARIAPEVSRRARDAAAPLRGRLVKALGLLAAADPAVVPDLLAWSEDADAKARRNAIIALGKVAHPDAAPRLVALATAAATSAPDRRSAVEALGKVGGPEALAALPRVPRGADAELARLLDQARLRLERTVTRDARSEINAEIAPERPLNLILTCRTGLEDLLAAELPGSRIAALGSVALALDAPLRELFRARLFIEFGFPLAPQPLEGADPVPALVRALTSDEAAAIFRRFTLGSARYRIAWSGGGHRRAAVLKASLAVAAARPELVNDPTGSPWEVRVTVGPKQVQLLLVPRLPDPRFSYRLRDVPAASHPTIAAAIARVGGARGDDVVWDPFVGSGTELVERARAGPFRSLHGTDLDEHALAAAAENLAAAGVTAALERRDALAGAPEGTTLILTNPPLGRRLLRREGAAARLLLGLLDVAARALPPGGRIAWISPVGDETAAHAARVGFQVAQRRRVDLGGFTAEIQLLVRSVPATSRPPRPSTSAAPRSRG